MSFMNRLKSACGFILKRQFSGKVYRLVIEISNACNLRCIMCSRNEMTRKIEYMNIETFKKIIEENQKHLEFVGLNGFGEPLIHPQLFELLNIASRYNIKTGISTNCTLLTEDIAEKLLQSGPDQLILAIDGIDAVSYEKVRVGAKFEKVITNVKKLLEMKEKIKSKTLIVLQFIYMPETKYKIKDIYKYFSDYKFDSLRIRQLTHSGNKLNDKKFLNRIKSCYWLWAEPMILSNGSVVPCCQDVNGELTLGNIKEKNLSDIWSKGRIQELRKLHSQGKKDLIPLCKDCNMYQPSPLLAIGASLFNTNFINKMIPAIETIISSLRYRD